MIAEVLCMGRKRAGRIAARVSIIVVFNASNAYAQSKAEPLVSAAIDASIFRDGEVKRLTTHHATWTVVCDEIARLKQRFCSLRTPIQHANGALAAVLTISNDQDDRPAALLKFAAALVAAGQVAITPTAIPPAASAQKPKPLPTQRIKPVTCDKAVCTIIWSLTADQIGALNTGAGLHLVATPAAAASSLATLAPAKPPTAKAIEFDIPAAGFADAVAVSMKPFE